MSYEQSLRELWGPELSRRVRFLGRVRDDEKDSLLTHCDAFVAPSLYESFGIVFLEAMRRGKPTIGTRVGGIPEIVLDGRTGLLVEPGNASDLARAMIAMATDVSAGTRMGEAGRERFLAEFSIEEFARRSEAFYREVIDHWRGSRFFEIAAPSTTEASEAA